MLSSFFTVFSIIPLGAGIIMPISAALILFSNFIGSIVILLKHLLINADFDKVLYPLLVPKEAWLDAALMLVSVFSGIAMFEFSASSLVLLS